jgi:hypothetical protein
MARKGCYHFNVGDKVRIKARPSSSCDVKAHDGEIVTIKSRCCFAWAYTLEEFGDDHFWIDGCFELVESAN